MKSLIARLAALESTRKRAGCPLDATPARFCRSACACMGALRALPDEAMTEFMLSDDTTPPPAAAKYPRAWRAWRVMDGALMAAIRAQDAPSH